MEFFKEFSIREGVGNCVLIPKFLRGFTQDLPPGKLKDSAAGFRARLAFEDFGDFHDDDGTCRRGRILCIDLRLIASKSSPMVLTMA
jgi:hypothetical protein